MPRMKQATVPSERPSFVLKKPSGEMMLVRDKPQVAVAEFLHYANMPQSKARDVLKALEESGQYASYFATKVHKVPDNMPLPKARPFTISRVVIPTVYGIGGAA